MTEHIESTPILNFSALLCYARVVNGTLAVVMTGDAVEAEKGIATLKINGKYVGV